MNNSWSCEAARAHCALHISVERWLLNRRVICLVTRREIQVVRWFGPATLSGDRAWENSCISAKSKHVTFMISILCKCELVICLSTNGMQFKKKKKKLWTAFFKLEKKNGGKQQIDQGSINVYLKTQKGPILLWPLPSILPLPYWVIYPQFLNASYGQSGICSEVPGLCGGNIIKVVKDVKGEEWGWHQANFTLGTRMARSKPGLLPRNTDQSALSPHQCRKKKEAKGHLTMLIPRTNIF